MARALVEAGVEVHVATTDDDGPGRRLAAVSQCTCRRDGWLCYYFPKQTEFYKYSRPFRSWLCQNVANYDIIHIHSLFSYLSVCAAHLAYRHRVPYIIRPLGVLNRWGMRNRRRVLKAISFRLIEAPLLKRAAAVHYTSHRECIEAEEAGVVAVPFVAPLGLDMSLFESLPDRNRFFDKWPAARGHQLVLFLSRLDPKKGLELLFEALVQVRLKFPKVLLVIAGTGPERYLRQLRERVHELNISPFVLWVGFLDREDKLAALSAADAYVLPSYSENFGFAVVEALAAGVPTIVSTGIGIADEIGRAQAGLVVAPDCHEIAAAVMKVLSDPELAQQLRRNGKKLAQFRYSLPAMGTRLLQLYERWAGKQPCTFLES
jgi:glycosyltransferase involved in cell wall biosynthesis